MSDLPFFATAAKGTEGALRDELRSLSLPQVKADRGGVHFGGRFEDAMRACFESRIALRVLWRRGRFEAPTGEALYEGVRAIELGDVLDVRRSLSVAATVKHGALTHSGFVAQKTKDALVDVQRLRHGARSNVSRDDPDVRVVVHVARDQAELFVDLSGESLHRRGYRNEAREAPMKETLAAAILRLCGWDRRRPLVDPMCGSGTLPIEAALWARDIAPGLLGRRYGFERWALYDGRLKDALRDIREQAKARVQPAHLAPSLMALDIDVLAVNVARKLAKRAGVEVHVERLDVRDFMGTDPPGHVVTNPPYGVRLARGATFETMLAHTFRGLRGHRISALCHDPRLAEAMQVPPLQEHALWNGDPNAACLAGRFDQVGQHGQVIGGRPRLAIRVSAEAHERAARVHPHTVEREYRERRGKGGHARSAPEARVQPAQRAPDQEPLVEVAEQHRDGVFVVGHQR
jgi:putative N6-adenine-specific DNA methylase